MTHTAGTVWDITDRKKAETALRESESKFRSYIELAPDGVFVTDHAGRFVETNPATSHMSGYSAEELNVMTIEDLIAEESLDETMAQFSKVKETGSATADLWVDRKDGSKVFVTVDAVKISETRLLGFSKDITDRKKAEEALRASAAEFRSLAEAMPQIVWIAGTDGGNAYVNQQWLDYTGQTQEETLGSGFYASFHPDDLQSTADCWKRAVETGGIYEVECRLRRADGVFRWWLIRGVPFRNADGVILKWFGTCTDIEDIKQEKNQLHSQAKELQAKNEELNRFNRAMSGRELRMVELKQEVNELSARLGVQGPYELAFMDDQAEQAVDAIQHKESHH